MNILDPNKLSEIIQQYANQSSKIPIEICIFLLSLSEYIRKIHNIRKSSNIIIAFLIQNSKLLPDRFKQLVWKQYTKRNFMYVREMIDIAKMQGMDTTRHDLHLNTLFRKFMQSVITNVRPKDIRKQMLTNNTPLYDRSPTILTQSKRLFKTLHLSSGSMLNAIFTGKLPLLTEKTKNLHRMVSPIENLNEQELITIIKNSSVIQLIRNLIAISNNKNAIHVRSIINNKFSNCDNVKLTVLAGAFASILETVNKYYLSIQIEKQIIVDLTKKGILLDKTQIKKLTSQSLNLKQINDPIDPLEDGVVNKTKNMTSEQLLKREYLGSVLSSIEVAIWKKALSNSDRPIELEVHIICNPMLLQVYKFDNILSLLFMLFSENIDIIIHTGSKIIQVNSMNTSVITTLIRRNAKSDAGDPNIYASLGKPLLIIGSSWITINQLCNKYYKVYWLPINKKNIVYPNAFKIRNLVIIDALEMVISQGKFEYGDKVSSDITKIEKEYHTLLN
jgi:hypothetical protein